MILGSISNGISLGVLSGIVFVLAGCMTFERLEKGLSEHQGRHFSEVINKIGYPTSQMEVMGKKVYQYNQSASGSYNMPVTQYHSGSVNTVSGPVNYYGTTQSSQPVSYNYHCTLSFEVDSSEVVQKTFYRGNVGGCESFAAALLEENKPRKEGRVNDSEIDKNIDGFFDRLLNREKKPE